jgi:hypothetical protein
MYQSKVANIGIGLKYQKVNLIRLKKQKTRVYQ